MGVKLDIVFNITKGFQRDGHNNKNALLDRNLTGVLPCVYRSNRIEVGYFGHWNYK